MLNIVIGAILFALAVALFIYATPEEGKPHGFIKSPTLAAMMPTVVLMLGIAGMILFASALFK